MTSQTARRPFKTWLRDSFCDTSRDQANGRRATGLSSASLWHTFVAVAVFFALPIHEIRGAGWAVGTLGFAVVLRAVLGFTYRPGSQRYETAWSAAYSLVTIGCALGWAGVTILVIATRGVSDGDSVMMMVLTSGFAGAGAVGLLPDRALARGHLIALMTPVIVVFATPYGGPTYQIALVFVAYFAFQLHRLNVHDSRLNESMNREKKYQALTSAAQEIVVIHRDGIILEVNPAFEKEFGYSASEMVGRHVMPLTPYEEHERAQEILRNQESGYRTTDLKRKDGTVFKGEVISKFFTYNEMTCKMVCIQNITRRLEAEDALRESHRQVETVSAERSREALESVRMKSEFLANMSHEIRTPLNAIIGIIELLGDTYPTDIQKRYLRTMGESSEVLLTLINDVLDFSKIDAGKMELESIQFSVASVIESQADLLSSRAQQKGINIVASVDSDLPALVRGDAGRIGQVLLNLIGNAIKFTSRGHVEVRAVVDRVNEGVLQARFEVVDTGEGLAAGVAERLFKPFTQADSSTSRKHGGTGLGLSICKRLVEAMGGTIGVESTAGAGSKFWFTLPLEIIDADSIRTKFSRGDWSSQQIFVMTDENSSARAVAGYLQSWGLTATIGTASWIKPGARRVYDAVICSSSYRRRHKLDYDGPILEIQNEGGPYHELAGAFASLTNPVRQSDLYNSILNALSIATPASLASVTPLTVATTASDGILRIDARVLVAEDNSTNQMLALAHLRKLGISAQPVANGAEALEALARGSYDLVLMDCQMPEMDGFEATRRIREMEKRTGAHIPIVALTANAFQEDRERCLAVGMDAYLAKPLRREQLITVLKEFLVRAA